MVLRSLQHKEAEKLLGKIKYQSERKKSRAVVGAQLYEDRKKRDSLKLATNHHSNTTK